MGSLVDYWVVCKIGFAFWAGACAFGLCLKLVAYLWALILEDLVWLFDMGELLPV